MTDSDAIDANAFYAQAQAAAGANDRATARQLLATVVWADPLHEAGWLLLSTVVDDVGKSIECLRHVLALNPANAKAQHWLALAERAQARQDEESTASAPVVDEDDESSFEPLEAADQPVPRLGRYLLDYKFVTREQLANALAAQQSTDATGQHRRLGELLVEDAAVSADRLTFALREQQRVRDSLADAGSA
jgi:hypothetical protein